MLPGIRPENMPRRTPQEIPVLQRSFPARVTSLHQVEITSHCNLRCVYCPSPHLGREKVHMERSRFVMALQHVRHYVDGGTQRELNLAGIGESTLHPEFAAFVGLAREAVGPDVELTMATNGLTASDELGELFARYQVRVYVSLHRPEKAGPAVAIYERHGVLAGVSNDPALNANDWAGQVEWQGLRQAYAAPCMWLRQGMVMAMADGRVTACCLDASGAGVIGHVTDPVGTLRTKPYDLCKACHQHVRCEGYDQRA